MENREKMTGITVKTNVIKRNGQEVAFDISKIVNAIRKANKEVEGIHQMSSFQIQAVADNFGVQRLVVHDSGIREGYLMERVLGIDTQMNNNPTDTRR